MPETKMKEVTRTLNLLSWDKRAMAGMLHIEVEGKSSVYYVRRIDTLVPTFMFQKVQPTKDGLHLPFPYTVHIHTVKGVQTGICHCEGYKRRKECRHVDSAITMVQEYNV